MNANFKKYFAIWFAHYSKSQFGGTNIEAAATYAATDCMNVVKGWNQEEIDDDINYWNTKLA